MTGLLRLAVVVELFLRHLRYVLKVKGLACIDVAPHEVPEETLAGMKIRPA